MAIKRHRNKALADLSIKFMQDMMDYNAQRALAPVKRVTEKSDEYYIYNRDDAFRPGDTKRANKAKARRVELERLSVGSYLLSNHASAIETSEEDKAFADPAVNPSEDAILEITRDLMLDMELTVAENFFTSTAITSNLLTLSTDAWDLDTTTSTPIDDFDTAIRGLMTSIAKKPSGALMGKKTFDVLKNHADILDRVKWSERGVVGEEVMANVVGVPIAVNSVINQTIKYNISSTSDFVFDNNVLVYYNSDSSGLRSANLGITFVGLYGDTAPAVRRYRDELIDSDVLELNWMYDVKLVSSLSGYLIKAANS